MDYIFTMERLTLFSDQLAERYGQKLQRISIDLALGCPNRENRYGAGCIFCAEDGSRARHLARNLNLKEQVESGVAYCKSRYHTSGPFIAYFQAFTSTFAPVEELRKLYEEVLSYADFKVVIIGTRPDALEPEKIAYLQELATRYEVWVELGVQTAHDRTLKLINRGHDFAAIERCVKELHSAQIHTACHVILGLPKEEFEDWMATADAIAKLPFESVKLHQLLVIKRTPLAQAFDQGVENPACPTPLNEYEYAHGAAAFLRRLPDHWSIMRLSADANLDMLLAPKWWMSKGEFLEFFRKYFNSSVEGNEPILGIKTADGTPTLYHPEFRQHFHSLAGANAEAEHKFIEPSQLAERLTASCVNILDIGFGLGGNAISAIRCAEATAKNPVFITSLELDLRTIQAALTLYNKESLEYQVLNALYSRGYFRSQYSEVKLILGDARATVLQAPKSDLVFLDGFSPDSNPELWSLDFLRRVKSTMAPDALLLSYSSAYPFRGALKKLGFNLGESIPFGRRRGGTIAGYNLPPTASVLSEKEENIVQKSTAGVPYRDYGLKSNRVKILQQHATTVARLRKMGVPKWYKR